MTLFDDQMDWHIDGVVQYADGSCETVWVNNQNDEAVFTPSTDSEVERYTTPCADCGEERQGCQCHKTHDLVVSFDGSFKKVKRPH